MSAWVEDPREPSGWRWDSSAPSGDPTVTQIFNQVQPRPRREFSRDDGSTYRRVSASEFESFDDVDSTTIVDPGAPD